MGGTSVDLNEFVVFMDDGSPHDVDLLGQLLDTAKLLEDDISITSHVERLYLTEVETALLRALTILTPGNNYFRN